MILACMTSSCPKYAVFCGRTIEGRTPDSKTVGLFLKREKEVSARNRWEEIARKAISGQKLIRVFT
jgi:hypothetical protein